MTQTRQTISPPPLDFQYVVASGRVTGLWRLLSGYRLLYLVANVAVGFAAASRTAFYYLIQYFIDDVLTQPEVGTRLPWVALGFLGLALVEGLFTFLSGRWAAAAAEGVTIRLRDYLYDHIQRLTFAYHDKTPTGELIQRATSDVEALRRFFAEEGIGAGRIAFLFLVNFIAIMTLSVKLALYSVIIMPIVFAVSIWFFRRIEMLYEKFQEQEAKLSTVLQENLTGIRVVKAFARQQYEEAKFETENHERFQRGRRLLLWHAIFWPTTDIIVGFQMLVGFYIGAMMAIRGEITIGTYLAYVGLLIWLIWPLRNLGRLIVQMSMGVVSFSRVAEIIRQEREPLLEGTHQLEGALHGEIVFEDVSFAYVQEEAVVLHDINFTLKAGQALAITGATGSGKSTLVNLLLRFYDYSSGRILLDGVELRAYPRRTLRQQIGLVQQEPFLFSRTIRENITYGVDRPVSEAEMIAAAQAAAIHDVILTFPDGYNTLVGERGVTLSGGQKQRVTLARTFLKDPRILILDDATSSVDTETEAAIREALLQLMPGRTTILIAHRVQTLMQADMVLVLERGRIAQCGSPNELLTQPGSFQQLYDLQSRIDEEVEAEVAAALT